MRSLTTISRKQSVKFVLMSCGLFLPAYILSIYNLLLHVISLYPNNKMRLQIWNIYVFQVTETVPKNSKMLLVEYGYTHKKKDLPFRFDLISA